MQPPFIHLNVHSEYSLANSIIRIKDLVATAVGLEMPAVAMTDLANVFGLVKFYRRAVAAGVKPICGVDAWVENTSNFNAPYRLLLLAKNQQGYKGLCRLLSLAHTQAQHNGRACLRKEWLKELNAGLIAVSAAQDGELGQIILSGSIARAKQIADEYQLLFPDRYYVELQRVGRPHEEAYIDGALEIAGNCGLPVVATNDVQFLTAPDFDNHEVRVCIHDGRVLNDRRRPRHYTDQQYFRTPREMAELFADIPEAITNTVEIAKRCNFELEIGDYYLPNYPVPGSRTTTEHLREQSRAGLGRRLQEHRRDAEPSFSEQQYRDRLEMELDVIEQMGFPGYFLIVADFIRWAKDNEIPVGPGRGSGAGSLVAWSLGITELDPIEHGLLFERFLNPERISLPDFDIDFCMEGRDRVIDYVANYYGRDRVSQIITYGTMAARAVVRDVGRVMGMAYGYIDKIAKLIPFEVGMTLARALEQEEQLRERYEQDEDVHELLDIAQALEGLARNVGKHAGGVVIAPSSLTEFTALYCEQGGDQTVTQYDKDDLEAIGLVKFDFLGLRTLTIIDRALKRVNEQRAERDEPPLDIAKIPMDDAKTYALLKACRTTALFQLESRGMKDLIQRLKPDRFEDLVALVALYRPGPLQSGMVDDFIDRKHGRARIDYPHRALEPILKPTYGVILYQEQVMEIARVLAGYSLGAADLLRRAMGKKKPEEMARQREVFLKGALDREVEQKTASYIFDLMEKFAGYGFNKSHSAAYALITYQTAWLKAHYPAQFMAASLSADMEHTDKVVTLLAECRDMGLQVLSPDVNRCNYVFEPTGETEILYGLGAVKGIGYNVVEALIEARNRGGPFKDLFQLCARVDGKRVNRRALETLIQAGALDGLGSHRASLIATLPTALSLAEQQSTNRSAGQTDLFGVSASSSEVKSFQQVPEWTDEQRLTREKETLGLYLSGHPIDEYRGELDQIVDARLADLNPSQDRTMVVAGMVVGLRVMNTRRGDRMAFVTLDDQTARLELAVFPELYAQNRDALRKDTLLVVQGQVSVDEYTGGFKMAADALYDIEEARRAFADRLIIRIDEGLVNPHVVERIAAILGSAEPGECGVWFHYCAARAEGMLRAGSSYRIVVSRRLLDDLVDTVGGQGVRVVYRRQPAPTDVAVQSAA